MKKFSEFYESAKSTTTTKFTSDELHNDYERASDVTGQEKKDLIAKYGINSKKAQDIKNKILVYLKDLRKDKKKFNESDLQDFLRLHDYVTSRMCEGLKDEPKEFQICLKDYYFERLKKRKLESYALVTSLSSFRFSIVDKDLIKTYQKIAKTVEELNPTAEKLSEKEHFEMINNKITELMQDFKVIYMKKIEEHAKIQYKYYSDKKNLEPLEADVKATEKAIEEYKKEKGIRWISYNDYIGLKYEKANEKARSKVSQFKAFTKMYKTEKSYLDKCAEDGENRFSSNIAAISDRLIKMNLNVANISISNVKNDPKFFEMMLTDGEKKLYLRSVFAAQFSEKMIPHFRFIITERK